MKSLIQRLAAFGQDESGATAVEYGLLAALMTVAIISGITALGTSNADNFNKASDAYPT